MALWKPKERVPITKLPMITVELVPNGNAPIFATFHVFTYTLCDCGALEIAYYKDKEAALNNGDILHRAYATGLWKSLSTNIVPV